MSGWVREYERARAEKWARVVVSVLAVVSVTPVAYFVGDRLQDRWFDDLVALGEATGGQSDVPAGEQGAYLIGFPVAAAAVTGFLLVMRARRRRTEASGGDAREASRGALRLTAIGWGLLLAGSTVVGTAMAIGGGENTSDVAAHFIDGPLWMVLTPMGLVAGVAMSYWWFARPRGLVPLPTLVFPGPDGEPAPAVPPVPSVGESVPSFVQGLRLYGRAWVMEIGFGLAALAANAAADPSEPSDELLMAWFVAALAGPGVVNGVLLGVLWFFPPTRWLVDEVFAQRLVRVSLALIVGGLFVGGFFEVLDLFDLSVEWGFALVTVAVVAGCVIAGVTGLYVQDLGPQPWLGIVFLGFVYLFSAFNSGGDLALPEGIFGWAVAVALGIYVAREVRWLWRRHYGVQPSGAR